MLARVDPNNEQTQDWGVKSCFAPTAKWIVEPHAETQNVAIKLEDSSSMIGSPGDRNYLRAEYLEKANFGNDMGFGFGRQSQHTVKNLLTDDTSTHFEGVGQDGFMLTLQHHIKASEVKVDWGNSGPPKDLQCMMVVNGSVGSKDGGNYEVVATYGFDKDATSSTSATAAKTATKTVPKSNTPNFDSATGKNSWTVSLGTPTGLRQVGVICSPKQVENDPPGSQEPVIAGGNTAWQIQKISVTGKAPRLERSVPVSSANVPVRLISVREWDQCQQEKAETAEAMRNAAGHGKDWKPFGFDIWCGIDNMQVGSGSSNVSLSAPDTPMHGTELAPFPDHTAADLAAQQAAFNKAATAAATEAAKKLQSGGETVTTTPGHDGWSWPSWVSHVRLRC